MCVTTGNALVQMHVTNWAEAQREDTMLSAVLDWLKAQKKTDLKALLTEHAPPVRKANWSYEIDRISWFTREPCIYTQCPKVQDQRYSAFHVVPKAHSVATLNGCHRDAGHQPHNHTLFILWECFWWPGMINQMQQSIKSCMQCLQHKGDLPKAPLHLIVATAPLDFLHIDFTSIQTTMELNKLPRVANVLVFQDHFMKHVLACVTPNQTAKTITKFLYQGYILISGAPARLLSDWGC